MDGTGGGARGLRRRLPGRLEALGLQGLFDLTDAPFFLPRRRSTVRRGGAVEALQEVLEVGAEDESPPPAEMRHEPLPADSSGRRPAKERRRVDS